MRIVFEFVHSAAIVANMSAAAVLRKSFKAFLGCRHGQSSVSLEAALNSAAFRMVKCMTSAEVELLPQWPVWADDQVLAYLTWSCARILGKGEEVCPDRPGGLPEPTGKRKEPKPQLSRGFDYYCYLDSEELGKCADKMKLLKKNKGMKKAHLMKVAAGQRWKKLDHEHKRIFAERAHLRGLVARGADGCFVG